MNKNEKIGSYRHQINFLKPVTARDDYGEKTIVWEQQAASFASVDFQQSRSDEDEVATRIQAFTYAEIRLRFRADINEAWRILYGQDTFDIEAILPDSHRRHMMIKAIKIEN